MKLKIFVLLGMMLTVLATGCGKTDPGSTADGSDRQYTKDELLLQKAHWYLQDEEKFSLSWDQGKILSKNFCAENSREVMGPDGVTDIQGMKLTQIRFAFCNLFFDKDTFIGMDYGLPEKGSRYNTQWSGDVQCWFWLRNQEVKLGEDQEEIWILRNAGRRELKLGVGSLESALFKEGESEMLGGGKEGSYKNVTLQPGEVYRVQKEYSTDPAIGIWSSGEYTVFSNAGVCEMKEGEAPVLLWFYFNHHSSFTIE